MRKAQKECEGEEGRVRRAAVGGAGGGTWDQWFETCAGVGMVLEQGMNETQP